MRFVAKVVIGVLIAMAIVIALAGCGQAKDPFVGTWRVAGSPDKVKYVISKQPDGYLLATGDGSGTWVLPRHGDKLSSSVRLTKQLTETMTLKVGAPGRLQLEDAESVSGAPPMFPVRMTLIKQSDSTATPVPVP